MQGLLPGHRRPAVRSFSAHLGGTSLPGPAGPQGLGGGQSLAPGVLVHLGVDSSLGSLRATGGGSFTPSSHLLAVVPLC